MPKKSYSLEKVAAGDYLVRFSSSDTIYRVTKGQDLGSGARGMFGITVWVLWRWPEPVEPATEPGQIGRWEKLTDLDTRAEAIRAAQDTEEERG